MKKNTHEQSSGRRGFIGTIATGAAALGIGSAISPFSVLANPKQVLGTDLEETEAWFNQIKGKHKMVFDATQPHSIFPFAWPRVFLSTNEATGTATNDNSVVVVLRHDAIAYAFDSSVWAKYNFGEMFKADDPATKQRSTRNPFWKPAKGDFKIPGVGEVQIGINELQESGVMFCVCNVAITVNSNVAAAKMNMKPEDVRKDWDAALLPGIKVVPSGVWAVGRAQEHGCTYCFAG